MKNIFLKFSMPVFLLVLVMTSCTLDDISNPNGPDLAPIVQDATKSELQLLVSGIQSLTRNDIGFYYDVTAIIGREYYYFTGSDPRYTGELLGKGSAVLDNAGFYGTRPFAGRYRTVKECNVLLEAIQNTTADISDAEKKGFMGFAKTMKAYELSIVLNLQYKNGIRVDVADPDKLGPFLDYEGSLSAIADLLDEANADLQAAGDVFAFTLRGFSGFGTPSTMSTFNRALAARIALYQGDMAGARTALASSFMDMNGPLDMGPKMVFSLSGGDRTNPVYRPTDQADGIIAHPSFVADMEANDDRASKIALRPSGTLALDDLSGDYDVVVFNSFEAPISYIRNEELILIMAEAQIGNDNGAAVNAINVIRNAHGIGDYSGDMTDAALLDEVLNQRRYSLFGEGHRWVDMRRLGRLGELPIDRTGDDVWEQMPRPVTE